MLTKKINKEFEQQKKHILNLLKKKLVHLKKRKIDLRFIQFPPFSLKPNISPLLFWYFGKLRN
jgi:hypothetical protein